jgi:hypothetical protein
MKTLMTRGSRRKKALVVLAAFAGLGAVSAWPAPWGERVADAYIRGGVVAVGGRGVVAVSRTTVVPGVGVSRAVVVGGRTAFSVALDPDAVPDAVVFRPPAVVAGRPGANLGYTATGINVTRITAGPSTGTVYRYGSYVSTLPAGCTTIFRQGVAAYRCGATTYQYDVVNGSIVYYPVVY